MKWRVQREKTGWEKLQSQYQWVRFFAWRSCTDQHTSTKYWLQYVWVRQIRYAGGLRNSTDIKGPIYEFRGGRRAPAAKLPGVYYRDHRGSFKIPLGSVLNFINNLKEDAIQAAPQAVPSTAQRWVMPKGFGSQPSQQLVGALNPHRNSTPPLTYP